MDGALVLCVSHPRPVECGSTHFDVFLSFPGGSDAHPQSFPSRLHASLSAAGVSVCGPHKSQAVGASSQLTDEAAWQSKICIPILSKDYPSSEPCLRGLIQMMEGKRSGLQQVLPIFNRVEPSEVRYLKGNFEKARHSDIEGVQTALYEVSMLHGGKVTDGHEEELMKTMVQIVVRCLQPDFQKVPQIVRYNVFLNFRGSDNRPGLTYNLYSGLVNAGVSVFKDDTNLSIGEDFGSQLLKAITQSTIYITVLSRNYAASKWCLIELEKMMECKGSMGHIVLPIFYKVEPRHVRHQVGSFGFGLRKRKNYVRRVGDTWEAQVLSGVSTLAGWQLSDGKFGEGLIQDVVAKILAELRHHFKLDVPEHLLRIDDSGKQVSRCSHHKLVKYSIYSLLKR